MEENVHENLRNPLSHSRVMVKQFIFSYRKYLGTRTIEIANHGLQSIGVMRTHNPDIEQALKKANSNDEVRALCSNNSYFQENLIESLKTPKELIEDTFRELQLKGKSFKIFSPVKDDDVSVGFEVLQNVFDSGLRELNLKSKFTKGAFPKLWEFYQTHCISRAYYFHVFKCENPQCQWHKLKTVQEEIPLLGEPIPVNAGDGSQHYEIGKDESESFLPSKSEDLGKRGHGMPFTPTAQTALNVGMTIPCSDCRKHRLVYSKKKLEKSSINALKRLLNDIVYTCRGLLSEIQLDDDVQEDKKLLENIFIRENISCKSNIEIPYYSAKIFKPRCIVCGTANAQRFLPKDPMFYPQCDQCDSPRVKIAKRKTITQSELGGKKTKNTHLILSLSVTLVIVFK